MLILSNLIPRNNTESERAELQLNPIQAVNIQPGGCGSKHAGSDGGVLGGGVKT